MSTRLTAADALALTSAELIARLESAGRTRYAIARETGIDQAALSRVASGDRKLGEDHYRTLADLALRVCRPSKKKSACDRN